MRRTQLWGLWERQGSQGPWQRVAPVLAYPKARATRLFAAALESAAKGRMILPGSSRELRPVGHTWRAPRA